jgi:hypothetical protein
VPTRPLIARSLVVAAALATVLALAACSTPTPSGGTGGNGGSGGTSGQQGSSQGEPGSGDSGSAGSGSSGPATPRPMTGRLPAGWPADVVVPEGEIVQAVSLDGSFVALVDVADTASAFAASSTSLQAAGYTVVSEIATDHGAVGVYENAERQVQVAVATSPDAGWTMSYTITEKG